MIDYSKLSEEKAKSLVDILLEYTNNEQELMKYLKKNAGEYVSLGPITPVSKLNTTGLKKVLVKYRDAPLISSKISELLDKIVIDIDNSYKALVASGIPESKAIVTTLINSVFNNDVDLYKECKGKKWSKEYVALLTYSIEEYKNSKSSGIEAVEKRLKHALDENEKLKKDHKEKCDDLSSKITHLQKDNEKKINELKKEISVFKTEKEEILQEYEKKKIELEEKDNTIKIFESEKKKVNSRTIPVKQDNINYSEHQFYSLCRVTKSSIGGKSLDRIADLSNGELSSFIFNFDEPKIGTNRNKLFHNDGPELIGQYAIWAWDIKENIRNPGAEFVASFYQNLVKPIRVICYQSVETKEELLSKIQTSVDISQKYTRTYIAFSSSGSEYTGFLLEDSDVEYLNEVSCKLKDETHYVKEYTINKKDVLKFGEDSWYRYTEMRVPGKSVLICNPYEISKKILLRRASWNEAKQAGFIQREWSEIKSFLESISVSNLYQEVAEQCYCSVEEAQSYISHIIENSGDYFLYSDIESCSLSSIINNNPELLSRCSELIREQWYQDNKDLVDERKLELDEYKTQKESLLNELEKIKNQHRALTEESVKLNEYLADKEKLASEVEEKINDRINEARKNAADFISSMAFVNNSVSVVGTVSSDNTALPVYESIKLAETDEYSDVDDLLSILDDNLVESGVSTKVSYGLGAFMYSAYISKVSLLLAGINSLEISQAFAASVTGEMVPEFDCSCVFSVEKLREITNCESDIFIIRNIFNSDWITHIDKILKSKAYVIFIHPISEDISVEPEGVFNYMLPVLTDLIVDNMPNEIINGGIPSSDFEEPKYKVSYSSSVIKQLKANQIYKKKMKMILSGTKELYKKDHDDIESLFAIAPYCIIKNQKSELISAIEEKYNLSSAVKDILNDFVGEDDE